MLRGKLADEGMLNEDICLGTKATTQRSETWKKISRVWLLFQNFSSCENFFSNCFYGSNLCCFQRKFI